MIPVRPATILAACAVLLAVPAAAQESRQALIERAIADFDREETARLLMMAADPDRAPPDSLWTFGVHYLAETLLLDLDDSEAASLWLRWHVRHGSSRPMSPEHFRPPAVDLQSRIAQAVERSRGPGDEWTRTSWRWSGETARGAPGALVITAVDPTVPLQASIVGGGAIQSGANLPPGSYELEVGAEGYELSRITREVLPGVTTVLELDPPPMLAEHVKAEVARRLALIAWSEEGRRMCADGLVVEGGVVLTVLDAADGVQTFEVTTAEGTVRRASVIRHDPGGLVALLVEGLPSEPAPPAVGVAEGQYVWSVYRERCAAPVSARSRLMEWLEPPLRPARLATSLPADAVGSPLVARTGHFIGLVTAADEMMPLPLARELALQAFAALPEARPRQGRGRGLWKWVGGAGAAGVLAVAFLGGSDDSPPDRGTIVLHIPGG